MLYPCSVVEGGGSKSGRGSERRTMRPGRGQSGPLEVIKQRLNCHLAHSVLLKLYLRLVAAAIGSVV